MAFARSLRRSEPRGGSNFEAALMRYDVELAIVGAGPQALTLLSYVGQHSPETLAATAVFDPEDWLAAWHRQFHRYRIPMLRSACVHHPSPSPYGLIGYARDHGREDEFHGKIGRPGTGLFADYCDHLIDRFRLRDRRIAARIVDVRPDGEGVLLLTEQGREVRARRAVLATNPLRPVLPSWFGAARARYYGADGVIHSHQWDVSRSGAATVVVGAGLTAAQIVTAQAAAGAPVTWITRSALRIRDLDVEAVWLGPELRRFHGVGDPRARVTMARLARGGGSVPADEHRQVSDLIDAGRVQHLVGSIGHCHPHRGMWQVDVGRQGLSHRVRADHVVCATGSRTHARLEPLLRRCRQEHPTRHAGGIPVLARDLRWPGTSLHVMGPLAVAAVGPTARTIVGARMAAERIVSSLGAAPDRQYPGPRAW
jgi:hypothetical protein